MAKQTKTLADVQTVTTVNDDQLIPITDASGNVVKVSLANLKTALLGGVDLNSINDGVFIMFHRNSDNFPLMVQPHKWPSFQIDGEIAEGVVVVEGGKILVIAPTGIEDSTIFWSSAAVNGGGTTTSDRVAAFSDWDGKNNTASQITHTECSDASYAPGFCANYSRVNANGKGMTTGKWWLPSEGELILMYANMLKINYALSQINGARQLAEVWYWSSTEAKETHAWGLHFTNGNANNFDKMSYNGRVRPVSAFLL